MAKKEGQSPKDLKESERIRKRNEELKEGREQGSFKELTESREVEEEMPVIFEDKVHIVKFKRIGWGQQNKLIEKLSKELGSKATPTEYERRKQEEMIKAMVTTIDGTAMDEAKWLSLPFDFGEHLRIGFFTDTGEIITAMATKGMSGAMIDMALERMGLLDENGNPIEGELVKDGENLKK